MVDSDTVWPTEEHLRQPELREAIEASPAASTFYPLGMKEAGYSTLRLAPAAVLIWLRRGGLGFQPR